MKSEFVYRLTHKYSLQKPFCAVRGSYRLEQLNLMAAYIQLIRDQLPDLPGAPDDTGEEDGAALLAALYGLSVERTEQPCSGTLDFYDNWCEYIGGGNAPHWLARINDFARPDAFRTVINQMITDSENVLLRAEQGLIVMDDDRQKQWAEDVKASIAQLHEVLNGVPVKPEWGWQTLYGNRCDGRIYTGFNSEPVILRLSEKGK